MTTYPARDSGYAEVAAGWTWPLHIRWKTATEQSWLPVLLLAATATVGLNVAHPIAANSPTLGAAVQTGLSLSVLAVAWALRAQFVTERRARDLVLLMALLMLGLIDLGSSALPAALGIQSGAPFQAAPMLGHLFVALAFAVAASIPRERRVPRDGLLMTRTLLLSATAVAGAELGGLALGGSLAVPTAGGARGLAAAAAHPIALTFSVGTAGVLLVAAIGFAREGRGQPWGADSLIAGALILASGARLCYLAVPALTPGLIAPRDGLRQVALVLMFLAVRRRNAEIKHGLAHENAMIERQRLARDLHDGLAQDLAFIAAHGERLAHSAGSEHPIVVAARRALATSRGAIQDLSASHEPTTSAALLAVTDELAQRFDLTVHVHADPNVALTPAARENVVRIVREAVVNAAKHGSASEVTVSLLRLVDGRSELKVCDNGSGIAGDGPRASGYGLNHMRERVLTLGGRLRLGRARAGGTLVEVVLP